MSKYKTKYERFAYNRVIPDPEGHTGGLQGDHVDLIRDNRGEILPKGDPQECFSVYGAYRDDGWLKEEWLCDCADEEAAALIACALNITFTNKPERKAIIHGKDPASAV